MKIPFQDFRTGGNRLRASNKGTKEVRFSEVCELIENCGELREPELMKLRRLVETKLMSYEEVRRTL